MHGAIATDDLTDPSEATSCVVFDYWLFDSLDKSVQWPAKRYSIVEDPIHVWGAQC